LPLQYQMTQSIFGSSSVKNVQFNWATKKAIYTDKKKHYSFRLTPDVLDTLGYQIQLRQDLLNNKKQLSYMIADKKLYPLRFVIDGAEVLQTPLGEINTVRLKTVRDNNKRETWIWLCPAWEYLPVKIKQRDGSNTFEADITRGSIDGKSLSSIKQMAKVSHR